MAINLLKQLAKDTISTKGQKAARKISLNYGETKSTLRDGDIKHNIRRENIGVFPDKSK
jgi:hypothetical protein